MARFADQWMAAVATILLSPEASHVTGAKYGVGGGITMR